MLQALHVVSEQMVLQPFEERADIFGVLQEPLWAENGSLRDSEQHSNDTRFARANSNNFTASLPYNQVHLRQFRTIVAERRRELDGGRYRMWQINQAASER